MVFFVVVKFAFGADNIVFPGLGIVVSSNLFIWLFIILDLVCHVLAWLIRSHRNS